MLKISENVVLKSVDTEKINVIQSKGVYSYRETIEIKNNGQIHTCINTANFLVVFSEGLTEIIQNDTFVLLKTSTGEYRLPIFRERGLLMSLPEVSLENKVLEETWEYDFSSKNIETKAESNTPSTRVVLGTNLLARVVNNLMEVYGDLSTSKVSIPPEVYKLVSKFGLCKLNLYSNKTLQIICPGYEIRTNQALDGMNLTALVDRITQEKICDNVDLSEVNIKSLKNFNTGFLAIILQKNKIVFCSEAARKTFEIDLDIPEPLMLKAFYKDLKYFTGKASFYKLPGNKVTGALNRNTYALCSEDKEKTVYLMVGEYSKGDDLIW